MSDDPILLGQQAVRLLRDAAFLRAYEALEARYIDHWRHSTSVEEREVWHARLKVLTDFTQEVGRIKDDGMVAEYEEQKRRGPGRPRKNPEA